MRRKCAGCEKSFEAGIHQERIYCTRRCKKNAGMRRMRKKNYHPIMHFPRRCIWCEKEFTPKRSDKIFCSSKCDSLAAGYRWRKLHPDLWAAQCAKWVRGHKETKRASTHRHRARKYNAPGYCNEAEWIRLLNILGDGCVHPNRASCCGVIHRDHIRPPIDGGTNWPDNLQPLCGHHNVQKNRKWVDYRTPEQIRQILVAFPHP